MCGIAGEIGYDRRVNVSGYHEKMLETLQRRGPDSSGIYSTDNTVLIHARLAVIDVERGRQPMTATVNGEEYTIVYNGELYNTDDIRQELIREGAAFSTHSDTEVLLKAYIQWKESCLKKLNGIFAFAVWEKNRKRLFTARDRMGVKPFFYYMKNGVFVFASELKALLCHPLIEPVIDGNGIGELLFLAPGRTPGCGVFKDVHELKAGEFAYLISDELKTEKYFELQDKIHERSDLQTVQDVKSLVTTAIERQLVSDVPIGTFLSGGLDSSIISALASSYLKKKGQKLHTFSVSYKDNGKYFQKSKFQPDSDDKYINIMTEFLGTEHHSIEVDTEELVGALFDAVHARDLPGMADIDSSLLLFCKEIKKYITVGLSGECADEIFGGYPWFRDEKIRSAYGFPWAQSTKYREGFLSKELEGIVSGTEFVESRYEDYIKKTPKRQGLSALESRMREMVYLNMHWFMQTLLDRKDRMSMYGGLEVRVPFCDHNIAEYMYSVPWELKDLKGREKGLLRAAMEGVLPEEILWRKKSPYPKTHNPNYQEAVRSLLLEILSDKTSPVFSLMNKSALEALLTAQVSQPWYGQLMTTPQTIAYIIQLNYWLKAYNVKISV